MRASIPCLALLSIAACASRTEPDRFDVDDYWTALGTAHCQTMLDCCTQPEYNDWWTTSDGVVFECERTHQEPVNGFLIRDAIADGTIVFDEGRARACIASLEQLACPAFEQAYRFRETYCASPLIGQLGDGATCTLHEQCAGGLCNLGDDATGTCATRLGEGEPCFVDLDECAAPLRCNDTGGGVFTCNRGLAAGATCTLDDQCANGWCKDMGSVDTCLDACNGL